MLEGIFKLLIRMFDILIKIISKPITNVVYTLIICRILEEYIGHSAQVEGSSYGPDLLQRVRRVFVNSL